MIVAAAMIMLPDQIAADDAPSTYSALPVTAQIDVLVDELSGRSLDDIYLSPAARALVERAAIKEPRDDGREAHGG